MIVSDEQIKKIVKGVTETVRAKGQRCNCDLDNWAPMPVYGHSEVCRIYQIAKKEVHQAASTNKPTPIQH